MLPARERDGELHPGQASLLPSRSLQEQADAIMRMPLCACTFISDKKSIKTRQAPMAPWVVRGQCAERESRTSDILRREG